jgi:hypothetical protein
MRANRQPPQRRLTQRFLDVIENLYGAANTKSAIDQIGVIVVRRKTGAIT